MKTLVKTIAIDLHKDNVSLVKSDGVIAELTRYSARGQAALKLAYEFKGAGHALVRIPVDALGIDLAAVGNYAFDLKVKGKSPANTLEFKVVDPSGENVWWVHRPSFPFASRWQTLTNNKRHFTYAWGPVNAPLSAVGFIELTVSASAGGKGVVDFAELGFRQLAAPGVTLPKPVVKVSSQKTFAYSVNTEDGVEFGYGWQSGLHPRQFVTVDYGVVREFDGLTVDFGDNFAVDYDVQLPYGKKGWRTVDTVRGGTLRRQFHALPESESRYVRLALKRPVKAKVGYCLKAIVLKPTGFASTMSQFCAEMAAQKPAGMSPRYFQKEQSFWTVVGVSGGREKAIINEEGMIEPALQAPSIEPFIYVDGKLLSWADGTHSQSLVENSLPMPIVLRRHKDAGIDLEVETLAQGDGDNATLYMRYTVKNTGSVKKSGSLYLALRHYQVNPPWQFLNFPGGFTPVRKLELCTASGAAIVNDGLSIYPLTRPDAVGATTLHSGEIVDHLATGKMPEACTVSDEGGFCSGALEYRFDLAAGQRLSFALAMPYNVSPDVRQTGAIKPFSWARAQAIMSWHKILKSASIANMDLPAYPELIDTVRSQLAYILVNRDGQALQPGSRCYRRTWIRDGSLTSEALLQLGQESAVRQFIDWFAPYQYPDGKVPCCVDKRGADPTPEHDSHGEFIYLVVEHYRYSKDRVMLARLFPQILKAVDYIDGLRRQRLGEFYQRPENAHLRGLMPESISHEGYSAKPAHSYWDDLFALKGLEDALFAANELGDVDAAIEIDRLHSAFKSDLVASVKASMAKWQIGFIPGAADRGDFDATSTTIALDPVDLMAELGPELEATFDAYWQSFVKRRDGLREWVDYTPYEWRAVGTFAKLGQIGRAHEAIDYFMKDRRPHGWNHWAEVVFKDPLTPRFIGDAPHGWVGSDFLRATRTLFAYEQKEELVVFAGVPLEWLEAGLRVSDMVTEFGKLSIIVTAEPVVQEAKPEGKPDGKSDNKTGAVKLTYQLSGDLKAPIRLMMPIKKNSEKRWVVPVNSLPCNLSFIVR